jgi:hypothetical protein
MVVQAVDFSFDSRPKKGCIHPLHEDHLLACNTMRIFLELLCLSQETIISSSVLHGS